jgi:hypothetical protein
MATILVGLQNIAAANAFTPDPQGTSLRKKLAVLLASTPLQLDPTMALIAGTAVYTSQLQQAYPPALPTLPTTPGAQVTYVTTATVGGSITEGDSLTFQVTSSAIPGSPISVSYQVQANDSFESIAASLTAQVNLNAALIAVNISASATGAVITLAAPPSMNPIPVWAFNPPPAGAAAVSETVTLAGSLVCAGPMTDATIAALSNLAGASSAFNLAVQDLYNQAQDIVTNNLGFLAAAGPYSVALTAPPPNIALPSGPVSFVPTVTVGTGSNQSSLTVTPYRGSAVQVQSSVAGTNPVAAAASLTTQINANVNLIAAGISATVSGATISLIVEPSSTPSQTWTAAVIAGPPSSTGAASALTIGTAIVVAPSDQVSYSATATVGGTVNQDGTMNAGDTLSLTMTPSGGSAHPPVTYVIQPGDTPAMAAIGLANNINTALSSADNISAAAVGAVITISGPSTESPLPALTASPSSNLTIGCNLVSTVPMLNSTRTNLIALAPALTTAVTGLYQAAWGTPVSDLIDNTQGWTAADAYDYVLQGLLISLTNTQSRNLVKQTLAQALTLDPAVVDLFLEGTPALGVPTGLLPSSFTAGQSAMSDFLGGLNTSSGQQWTAKLLIPTTGAYNFAFLVNGVPATSPQSSLVIGGQPITLYTPGGAIVPINLTAGQMYSVSVNAPAGTAISWRIAPAPLTTLTPIPNLAFMPCDGNWSYPNLALLYRLAVLINGFSMAAEDVAYLSTHSADFAGTDPATGNAVTFSLAGLSAAATLDAPALFNQWQRLNAIYSLKASLPNSNTTLFDVFAVAAAPGASLSSVSASVVQEVTAATGWNPADIATLTASGGAFNFLDANFRNEMSLVKMATCISICATAGISSAQLFTWANPASVASPASPFETIAQDIQHTVKAKYDQPTWLQVGKPLNDKIREATKEALINYILYLMPNPAYSTIDDLYGFFLIDVQMCTCMETSRLVQASAAVQLFVQRCLLGLESENANSSLQIAPSAFSADAITEWNQWRKNYRVWQAAVEVFLYPENWIIPELRSNQTPFFEDLVTTLLQGEVNEANAEAAFLGYLESLQQVARLEIVGVYTDNDTDANTQVTHVIARTFTTPYVFFYRTLDNKTYLWSPWEKITADISGDTLIPVIWNRRLFIFWPVYTEVTDPTNSSQNSTAATQINTNSGSTTVGTPPLSQKMLQIQLAWSEYKDGQWTPKQITTDYLVPEPYQAYSSAFDPTTIFYTARGQNSDGLVVTAFSTSMFAIPDIPGGSIVFTSIPGGTTVTNNGQTVASNISSLFSDLYNVLNSPPVNQAALDPSNQFAESMNGGSEPPVVRAIVKELGSIYHALGGNAGAISSLDNLVSRMYEIGTTGLTNLGTFTFDGPQGSVEIDPDQNATVGQTNEFSTAASLYVFNAKQIESAFVSQSVEQYDSHLSVIVSGTPVGLFSAPSTPLPYTLVFPQQLLPAFSLGAPSGSFQNVFFYADRRRTYFVVEYLTSTVIRSSNSSFGTVSPVPGSMYFFNHYHPWVGEFIKRVNWPDMGVSALLDPRAITPATQTLRSASDNGFNFSTYYGQLPVVNSTYANETVDFSGYTAALNQQTSEDLNKQQSGLPGGSAAYSIYNWELFFYAPLMIAIELSENQQFDDAETWFRYIFDPTIDPNKAPPAGYSSKIPNCYWNFLKFNQLSQDQGLEHLLSAASDANLLNAQLAVWNNSPFDPDVIAEFRFVAYQKTTVMKYLDHLIRRGDYCFGQNTRESIYEAIQYYILADQILGAKPVEISQPGIILDETYWDLLNDPGGINALGNANVQLENAFPFVVSGTVSSSGKPAGPTMLPTTPYFCTPDNPTLLGYYDTVADRLYKIRHCMNIQGQVEQLALFSSPINPGLLVAAEAAGVDLSSVLNDINAAVPHYRFTTMMGKALELCSEVRSLGSALLSNLEKSDAEGLALLRAGQELAVQQAVLQIKQLQIQEANANLAGLQATLAVTTARQTYYQGLIQGGLSSYETAQLVALGLSEEFKIVAQASGTEAAAGFAIPQIDIGINGVFGTPSTHVTFGGVQVAGASSEISKAFSMLADMSGLVATMAGLSGGWNRRNAEWQFQLETATLEIAQIQQQISAATFRVQIATDDANNQNLLIANAAAVQSTLKSKFTNQDLYQWMVGQVSAVFFQCYQMAYDLAKRAEACYRFELGVPQSSYIQFGYWDSLKKGLLSGEKLFQDLKRLEVAYLDQNLREYEISKSISLLLLDPSAFVTLKLTGSCLINLPEAYFDMDYPGHYLRRIRNVSLTIPCVTGPYTSVNCTLTLLQSRIRLNNSLPTGSAYAEKPVGSDSRFAYNFSATESIATSTAQNDSGLFEVNFRDERYLPFEGSGVISQWQLDMPLDSNAFDFETITDLIVNLRYSARNGGDSLRTAAKKAALLPPGANPIPPLSSGNQSPPQFPPQSNLQRYFSLRHEYPTEWYKLMNPPAAASGAAGTPTMQIDLGKERFPFQYRSSKTITITEAQFITVTHGQPSGTVPTVTSGAGNSAQTKTAPNGSPQNNTTVFSIPTPPQPSALAQGGPVCWTLTFNAALTAVADIILICTYSVPAR